MTKLIKYLIFSFTILILLGCQLVYIDKTTETSTNQDIIRKPYAIKLKLDENTIDYYVISYYRGDDEDKKFTTSHFYSNVHIHLIGNDKEIITGNYHFDMDRYQCVTLSYLFINENDKIEEHNPEMFCEDQAHISYTSNNYSHSFTMNFVDVDILESIEIVEFDKHDNKLKIQRIDLNNPEISVFISKDAKDFLINKKYIDKNGEAYYVRKLVNRTEIEGLNNKYSYYPVIGLNQENVRQSIVLRFSVQNEGLAV